MPTPPRAYLPDLLFAGGRVHEGAALSVADGAVVAVGEPAPGFERVRLAGKALLPGLVSAHSHSFQRAIRGRTEVRHAGRSDFWSWREAMYRAAAAARPRGRVRGGPHGLPRDGARRDHRRRGVSLPVTGTRRGGRYDDPTSCWPSEVDPGGPRGGLRIALLRTAYARGGPRHRRRPGAAPLRRRRRRRRSCESSIRLEAELRARPARHRWGSPPTACAPARRGWIGTLAAEARRRGWPLHVHVAEQPAEVEQCRAEHGLTPGGAAREAGRARSETTTAVHAIHLTAGDVDALGRQRDHGLRLPHHRARPGRRGRARRRAARAPARGSRSAPTRTSRWTSSRTPGRSRATCASCGGSAGCSRPQGRRQGTGSTRSPRRLYGFASRGRDALARLAGRDARAGRAGRLRRRSTSTTRRSPARRRPTSCRPCSSPRPARRFATWCVAGEPCVLDGAAPAGRPGAAEVARDFRPHHEEALGRMRWTSSTRCSSSSPSTRPRRRSNLPVLDWLEPRVRRPGLRDPPHDLARRRRRREGEPDRPARSGRAGRAGARRPHRLRPLRPRLERGALGRGPRRQALRPRLGRHQGLHRRHAPAASARAARRRAPLWLLFTADEEVGCQGAKALAHEGRVRPATAIVGEPTRLVPGARPQGLLRGGRDASPASRGTAPSPTWAPRPSTPRCGSSPRSSASRAGSPPSTPTRSSRRRTPPSTWGSSAAARPATSSPASASSRSSGARSRARPPERALELVDAAARRARGGGRRQAPGGPDAAAASTRPA